MAHLVPDRSERFAAVFDAQARRLWGLAYRLTGSTDEADDIVQEAFARLIAQRNELPAELVGPWLVRVTTNLGIDALRRRRRGAYVGPWLPAAVARYPAEMIASVTDDPEARYASGESMTFAFLIALEVLGPRQRAVLLLRDAMGYSARETAQILDTTEGNVRVIHLRARAAFAAYDERRCIPTPELCARHRDALERLLACMLTDDAAGLTDLLAPSAHTVTDAAGEYTALRRSVCGRERVARFYLTAARHRRAAGPRARMCMVNGLPAMLITLAHPTRRQAPRTLVRCELDESGHITAIQAIIASRKLADVGV